MKIIDLFENTKPRIFYRATNPGRTERISTGNKLWDSYLFAASNIRSAAPYGSSIERIDAKPDANILYEGTKAFIQVAKGIKDSNYINKLTTIVTRAKEAGYDAVHFKRQSDIGTVIINQDMFIREVDRFEYKWP